MKILIDLQFESTILSNFTCSAPFCLTYRP